MDLPNRVYTKKGDTLLSQRTPESEKTLEARLRKEVEKRGGMALKLSAQLHRGLPDRLILLPGGRMYFAEIKTTGKKPTKLQIHCHEMLRALGFEVFVIDSTASLEEALTTISFGQLAVVFEKASIDLAVFGQTVIDVKKITR